MAIVMFCRPLDHFAVVDPLAYGPRRVGHTRMRSLTGPRGMPVWREATHDARDYEGRHRKCGECPWETSRTCDTRRTECRAECWT